MSFTDTQLKALSAKLNARHVRTREKAREKEGLTLSYIEGWHAIAEANRIFGFYRRPSAWRNVSRYGS